MEKYALRTAFFSAVRDAELLTGIQICVQDMSGFLHQQQILLPGDTRVAHHDCAFCAYVRDLPGGRGKCVLSDLNEGVEAAHAAGCPTRHICHAGLEEVLVPLIFQGKLIAVLFLGQAALTRELPRELDSLGLLGADRQQTAEMYRKLPQADPAAVNAAARLLQNALQEVLRACPEEDLRMYFLQNEYSLAARVLRRVHHGGESLRPAQLAAEFFVSTATLDRAFRKEFGLSVQTYLDNSRFSRAVHLLCDTRQSMTAISTNLGFSDTPAFYKWFRRHAGITPGACRQSASAPASPLPVAASPAEQVRRALLNGFRSAFRVQTLAKEMHLSADHLNRCFKQATGKTVTQALWALRLEAARTELSRTQAPVSWIARQTGFPSESVLDARFRQAFGCTPTEYRAKQGGNK